MKNENTMGRAVLNNQSPDAAIHYSTFQSVLLLLFLRDLIMITSFVLKYINECFPLAIYSYV